MHPLVVNMKYEEFDVNICRPNKYGNPFVVGIHGTRKACCKKYVQWISGLIEAPARALAPSKEQIRADLKGKRLGCVCAPLQCHGDYLAHVANPVRGLFTFK